MRLERSQFHNLLVLVMILLCTPSRASNEESQIGETIGCRPNGDASDNYERRLDIDEDKISEQVRGRVSGRIHISKIEPESLHDQYLAIEMVEYDKPDIARLEFVHRQNVSSGKGYITSYLISSRNPDAAVEISRFDVSESPIDFELTTSRNGKISAVINGESTKTHGAPIWPTHFRVACSSITATLKDVVVLIE